MKMWIAKDKVGIAKGFQPQLALYENKPFQSDIKEGMFFCEGFYTVLPRHYFPEVTFENSPKEVELKLIEKLKDIPPAPAVIDYPIPT